MKSEIKDVGEYTLNELCELKTQIEKDLYDAMRPVFAKWGTLNTMIKVNAEWMPPHYSGLRLDVKFTPKFHEELFYIIPEND